MTRNKTIAATLVAAFMLGAPLHAATRAPAHVPGLAAGNSAANTAAVQDDEGSALYMYRPDTTLPAAFLTLTGTMLWLSYWIVIDDNRKQAPRSLG